MTVYGVVLAAARMAPMALLSPALGRGVVPRLVVAAALTAAVAGSIAITATTELAAAVVARELGIGLLLTLAVSAPFWAAELAGRLVDQARGARGPLDAGLSLWALALWCAVGGPRSWVTAAAATYGAVPLSGPVASSVTAAVLIDTGARLFGAGLAMAAPALAVLLVVDLGSSLLFRDGGLRSWAAIGAVAVTAAAALAVLGRELGALKAFGL